MSQTRKIGKTATTVMATTNGMLTVVYHNTMVVEVAANGDITLDSGGWWTATTKLRMNQASHQFDLGFLVYQKEFKWYVVLKKDGAWDWDNFAFFGGGNGHQHIILSGK